MPTLDIPTPVRLLADSTNWTDSRLTSMLIPLPTCLLAELRTHRLLLWGDDADFSVNANSDRAIPVARKVAAVEESPYIPLPSLHQPGMSAIEEVPEDIAAAMADVWRTACAYMVGCAKELAALGASKQYVNRLLMPFSWSLVVVTGDDRAWDCFFKLRTPMDVEPNFRTITHQVKALYDASTPKFLEPGEWHISFREEAEGVIHSMPEKLLVSASCCARISFANEKQEPFATHFTRAKNVLAGHTSIIEHQARCPEKTSEVPNSRNVRGWELLRQLHEDGDFNLFGDALGNNIPG